MLSCLNIVKSFLKNRLFHGYTKFYSTAILTQDLIKTATFLGRIFNICSFNIRCKVRFIPSKTSITSNSTGCYKIVMDVRGKKKKLIYLHQAINLLKRSSYRIFTDQPSNSSKYILGVF